MTIRDHAERGELAAFLRRDPRLHLYELGDLDDFFWPKTRWFVLEEEAEILETALLYSSGSLSVLLAMTREPARMVPLLAGIRDALPRRFYAHLSPGLEEYLAADFALEARGGHLRMTLSRPDLLARVDDAEAVRLTAGDLADLLDLYQAAYPGNWFDPRMLETGQYFGIRREGQLASAAGIHVYSPDYGVAALGNITTRPRFRRQGLGQRVTARLCRSLLEAVPLIGLNVQQDNTAAVSCYEGLGFSVDSTYGEYWATAISP